MLPGGREIESERGGDRFLFRFLNQRSDVSWKIREKCVNDEKDVSVSNFFTLYCSTIVSKILTSFFFFLIQKDKVRARAQHAYEDMLASKKYELELKYAEKLGVSPRENDSMKDKIQNVSIRELKVKLRAARSKDDKATLNVPVTESAVISSSTTKTRSVAPYHKFNLYPTRTAPKKDNLLTADSKHFDPERRMSL